MKYILLLLIVFGNSHILTSQESKKDYSEAFNIIEVWLDAQKDYEKLPGISVSVVEDQELLYSGAFGMSNMEIKRNTENTTLCSICSISKLFTAVSIMKLYDEGKLRLDDRVEEILPWYDLKQQFPDSGPLTVRSLLTHSSGLPREANAPYWTGPDFPFPTQAEVKEGLKTQETLYPASTYYQYSNLGLSLLGEIVEELSTMSYDAFVKQNILDPLNMSNTYTDIPEQLYGQQLAVGYSAVDRKGIRDKVKLFKARGIRAAAGFASNVLDLAKFANWQFRLLDTTAVEILKPSTLKLMHNVHFTDPSWDTTWGLGFVVSKASDGGKWVSHGGSCPGYRSTFRLHTKSKRAYAVMINASGTNPSKYVRAIHELLNKVKSKMGAAHDNNEKKNLEEYTGYYSFTPWQSERYIASWENQIAIIRLPTDSPTNSMNLYKHIDGDVFKRVRNDGELGEKLIFERDDTGKIYRVSQHGNYSRRIRP